MHHITKSSLFFHQRHPDFDINSNRTMGCKPSKLDYVDDSIHVMLSHECKMAALHGRTAPTCYKPRQPHPLLDVMDSTRTTELTVDENESENDSVSKNIAEADRLLRCAAQHNDVVDARDLRDSKGSSLRQ